MVPEDHSRASFPTDLDFADANWLEFRPSPIHGLGGFARQVIPRGTRILEYQGERISKPESIRRCSENNPCIFYLDEHLDLDGARGWNPARFLNHSCAPNSEALLIAGRIWIVVLREIAPGEEVTFNYGYDLEDFRAHPCHCGAPGCVGYILDEAFWPQATGGQI